MERRKKKDRRKNPTPMLSRYSFVGGRRLRARRKDDRRGGYYVDRYGSGALLLFIMVIFLNVVAGFLGFYMLHALGNVDHPFIRGLREMGGGTFILVAFIVGSLFALFLFLHKNFTVARIAIGAVILFQIITISTQVILILFFHAA